MLIATSADVNARDLDDATLLIIAVINKNTEIARLFIADSVDVDARNIYGSVALMLAEAGEHTEIAQLLRDAGAR